MTISVQNRQRKHRLDLGVLRQFAAAALDAVRALPGENGDQFPILQHVGAILVSDRRIARLHFDFMQISGPTDVLTFDEGDIVISVETAARHAAEYSQSLQQEVGLYILHGLLHLRGFDDLNPKAAARMNACQNKIFDELTAT